MLNDRAPQIEMIADENRMFRAKIVKSKINDWNDIVDDTGRIKEGQRYYHRKDYDRGEL